MQRLRLTRFDALLFMLIAAPLASYIPLAALAAVLVVVAWTMAEKQEFATLLRSSWGDAVVLLATFLPAIFRDLTHGVTPPRALSRGDRARRRRHQAGRGRQCHRRRRCQQTSSLLKNP